MTPQDLVCARCWRDFFNTEAYERCCTYNHLVDRYQSRSVEAVATAREIRDADCTWCEYMRTFDREDWAPEAKITVHFSPTFINSCTPQGRNVFHLSTSCNADEGKWRGGYSLFVQAWTTADDPAAEFVTARPPRPDVDGEAAKIQLRTWLDECSSHDGCRALQRDPPLPKRVIEISPIGKQHPRLLESEGLRGNYATLSYCWGERPFPVLTESIYGGFLEELNPAALPLTFQHAISTARNLSIPYLWIDALCIFQDSENDKAKEIAHMKQIYASSSLTIVAASARSVSEGFLSPRLDPEPSYTIPFRIRPGVFGTISVNNMDAAGYDERLEPLAKRAWSMQEQLLAQRTLTFTSHTMTWRCKAGTRNFGDSLHFPHTLGSGYNENDEKYSLNLRSLMLNEEEAREQKDKALSCWMRVVRAYSLRTASLECDKLNALGGIVAHPSFLRSLGPQYHAGLWQYGLAKQLLWCTSRSHRALPEHVTIYRPATYRAPSWSWASIEGGVIEFNDSFDDEDEPDPEIFCDIIECSTIPKSPELNPFGEVLSGLLMVKSVGRKAWFSPSTRNVFLFPAPDSAQSQEGPDEEQSITFDEAWKRHLEDFVTRYPDVDLDEDPEFTHGTDHRNMCGTYDETGIKDPVIVLCMAITRIAEEDDKVEGLLLLPDQTKEGAQMYKRAGVFSNGRNIDFQKSMGTEMEVHIV